MTGGKDGEDDIALVNARTGKDTGKRVSSGEKIVFSEETLKSLSKALKQEDKSAVFDLVKDQVTKKPKKNAAGGGYFPPDRQKAMGYWQPEEEVDLSEVYDSTGGIMNADIYNLSGNPAEMPFIPAFAPKAKPVDRTTHTGVSVAEPIANTTAKDNLAYWIPSAAGNAMDSFRFALGMSGADTDIPKWNKPGNWNSYINELMVGSRAGYSPAERSAFQTQQDRQYLADISNINNASGGSNAIALGNYGRANTQQYLANQNFAA